MMRRTAPGVLAIALLLALWPAAASATTVVRVSDVELTRGATAIVVARVLAIQTSWLAATRQVVTDVTVSIDEVLAGDVPERFGLGAPDRRPARHARRRHPGESGVPRR
ncbi:MAG: hypothetical protein HYU41_26690 [Candidatus Rokubacteria bacterium]|nr:hypothetical protein [Candidatus Rokubacteria bacterium]